MGSKGERVRTRKPRRPGRGAKFRRAGAWLAAVGWVFLATPSQAGHATVTTGGPTACVVIKVSPT